MKQVFINEIYNFGLLEFLRKNKNLITKDELYDICKNYIYENYMYNGQTHIEITLKVINKLKDMEK